MEKTKVSNIPCTLECESFDYNLQIPNLQSSAHSYHIKEIIHIRTKAIGKGRTTARETVANTTPFQPEERLNQGIHQVCR